MKKIAIICAVVLAVVGAGLAFLLVTTKTEVYATSITPNCEQINLSVEEEYYIFKNISFDIEPKNCDQKIEFSIDNDDICSLNDTSKRLFARQSGNCTLRVSIKSAKDKYIFVEVPVFVAEKQITDDQNVDNATSIFAKQGETTLYVGESTSIWDIFSIEPNGYVGYVSIKTSNETVCQYDDVSKTIVAKGAGKCRIVAKIQSASDSNCTATANITVMEPTILDEVKSVELENKAQAITLCPCTDFDELQTTQIDLTTFELTYSKDVLYCKELTADHAKFECSNAGNFDVEFESTALDIVYHLQVEETQIGLSKMRLLTKDITLNVLDNFSLDSLQFENEPSDCIFEYTLENATIAKIADNTLQAIFIGTTTLKVQVACNEQKATFEIGLTIQKGTICFEKTFLLDNLKNNILTIDVARDFAKIKDYAKELSSEQVNCTSQTIFVTAIQNNCVTMCAPCCGTATLTIQTENIDIVYSIAIE